MEAPELPVPISVIHGQYYLFDINAVTYLRREHNICGVLIGTLPQIPQQNVFLSLPLALMPEEARILVEKGVAYLVNDVKMHTAGIADLAAADKKRHMEVLRQQGQSAMQDAIVKKDQQREELLKRKKIVIPTESTKASAAPEAEESLFGSGRASPAPSSIAGSAQVEVSPYLVTPATSYPPFTPPKQDNLSLPKVPKSYPLFAHLHSKGYFLSPGLRFGCQYMAYPGDPLRFHSHFLTVGMDWDQEFDLIEIIGGGRLGTGVKKGFLIGGAEETDEKAVGGAVTPVKTFSIEWAGM